jgi:transposase InsO family protein
MGERLAAAGLVVPRRGGRHVPPRRQPLAHASAPTVVWSADFKGAFALGAGGRCAPLTICAADSRELLRGPAVATTTTARLQPIFAAAFRESGWPTVLRTDHDPPFASLGAGGVTALSGWWGKLGIVPERIDPGHPEQNGRHERLQGPLKVDACQPPAPTRRGQPRPFPARLPELS